MKREIRKTIVARCYRCRHSYATTSGVYYCSVGHFGDLQCSYFEVWSDKQANFEGMNNRVGLE